MIPIFIPSYKRSENCKTLKYFAGLGYDVSKIFIFIDDEANDKEEYEKLCEKYGCNLVVLNIEECRNRYDYVHRASKSRRSAGQFRNSFADFAIKNNIDFYVVQDDDTISMTIRQRSVKERNSTLEEVKLVFSEVEKFMRKNNIGVFGLSQSGDLIGGDESLCLLRKKVMNTTFYLMPFIYRGERGVQDEDTSLFSGIYNFGLFTGSVGRGLILHQTASASAKGGLTELYNECKLLNKSLVVPIQFPSAVYAEKQKKNGGRLHHHINNRFLMPKILRNANGRGNIAWDTYPEDMPFTNEPRRKI